MTDTRRRARRVHIVAHPHHAQAQAAAATVARGFANHGIAVTVGGADDLEGVVRATGAEHGQCPADAELVLALGGDGTMLRAVAEAFDHGVGVLGVNLGRVGFLAEAEVDDLDRIVDAVVTRAYSVEPRLCVSVTVSEPGGSPWATWALNEVSISRADDGHVLDLRLEIDGEPLSEFGADGLLVATATGSTAYSFSAGGPVIWPQVEAMCVVPVSAHALFARPLVVAPDSVIAVSNPHGSALLSADGRRNMHLPRGSKAVATRHPQPALFIRIHPTTFTRRLVRKFHLPVQGWRNDVGETT